MVSTLTVTLSVTLSVTLTVTLPVTLTVTLSVVYNVYHTVAHAVTLRPYAVSQWRASVGPRGRGTPVMRSFADPNILQVRVPWLRHAMGM